MPSSRQPHTSRPTPLVRVDVERLAANILAMADHALSRGLALRPHAKTHKTAEIARLQLEAGAVGLTVATVAEAERFAAAGFDNLFIAYPLWLDQDRARRLAALADDEGRVVIIGVDSVAGVRQAATTLGSAVDQVAVRVEVDSGHHRTGIEPVEAASVAVAAAEAGFAVDGVFTFPGHSYRPDHCAPAAIDEAAALVEAADALVGAGFDHTALSLSGGSTPSAAHASTALTELRPGVYVFGDAQQWELGVCRPDAIALWVEATVVSSSGDRVVVDAGSKVLGADRPSWVSGFGRLLDHPAAEIIALSEHHGVIEWRGGPRPAPGSRLAVVPNHVCACVNLADELVIDGAGSAWSVVARNANT